ncbi:MAG: hypothetical protein WCW33_04025 [Candidatus Babeliales bacterium]
MKRIALATLLALCGARVYGVNPVEQPKVVATQEDVKNVQKFLNDTKNIDAIADQLGLPKEEVKSWFSRHKVITTSAVIVAAYAALYGISCAGKPLPELTGDKKAYSKLERVQGWLNALAWAQKPVDWAGTQLREHSIRSAIIAAIALLVIYQIYQGKDSAAVRGWNWMFGKDAVEEAQLVAALAAAEATPVPAKVEEVVVPVVVATVENKVEEATPVVEDSVQNKEEVTQVVTPVENKVEEVPVVVATVENKVEEATPVVEDSVQNKEEVTPVVTPVENKVEEVPVVVATVETKVEEATPVVEDSVQNKEEATPVVTPVENKVEEAPAIVAAA